MIRKTFQKNRLTRKKGFTLIEMLVSIALFSIVITIAMGSIFTIIDANRKSQTLTLVMNNLNFALEIMTRDIKTSDPSEISDGGDVLRLRNQEGEYISYKFNGDTSSIEKSVGENNYSSDYYSVISGEVVIEKFYFEVINDAPGGGAQPRVVLIINGYAQITERTRSDFNIQTTVSPRSLNI